MQHTEDIHLSKKEVTSDLKPSLIQMLLSKQLLLGLGMVNPVRCHIQA